MRNNPWFYFSMIILLSMGSCTYFIFGGLSNISNVNIASTKVSSESILVLDLEGVIIDGRKFLSQLDEYGNDDSVKGILVRVNSPGGVVGPSQEIYEELKKMKAKKPVYVSANGLMASGAFYAAMGATKIYSNAGSLLGSIGVIMNFADLSGLYSWAKIKRYNLTTGQFKDTGSDFREMTDIEKAYLTALLNETLGQFILAVSSSRSLPEDKVKLIADGRVFTGIYAKSAGLIDEVGTMSDALSALGEQVGLGSKPKVFKPGRKPEEFFEMLSEGMKSLNPVQSVKSQFSSSLSGRPLFLFPQHLEN